MISAGGGNSTRYAGGASVGDAEDGAGDGPGDVAGDGFGDVAGDGPGADRGNIWVALEMSPRGVNDAGRGSCNNFLDEPVAVGAFAAAFADRPW
jgi:hypothetical protein